MAERGIDISNEFPKPWTDETVRAADVVISMGCGDACPILPGKRYESWDDLDDPAGIDTAGVRPIRDDIERRVRQLIDELALTPAADQRPERRSGQDAGPASRPEGQTDDRREMRRLRCHAAPTAQMRHSTYPQS
jgi:Low molecular weight phosphotyrosine protein phosphatase